MRKAMGSLTVLVVLGAAVLLASGYGPDLGSLDGTTADDGQTDRDNLSMVSTVVDDHPGCEPFRINGDTGDKADILLVAKDYGSDSVMRSDLRYFMDWDGDNRGLFAIYPMDEYRDRFNIWLLDAGTDIADYEDPRDGRGLIKDSRRVWFPKCPFADYKVVLAKEGIGRSGFAYGGADELWLADVHRKHEQDLGAKGLMHEWGHAFGGLKDEYYSEDGRDAPGKPNCADSREQAERWWGDLAEENDDVGYYRGCSYNEGNWRPHEKSIMGNGGLHSYGPVNDRKLLDVLSQYE